MRKSHKLLRPIKVGHVPPSRHQVTCSRKGEVLDFTNGQPVVEVGDEVLRLAARYGYLPTEQMCLALHGKGSVMPHTDHLFGNGTLVWLVADNTKCEPSCLMVAAGNDAGVMKMEPGDVVLFNARVNHAWVSNSSWSMFVVDVTTVKRTQHRDFKYLLPKESNA